MNELQVCNTPETNTERELLKKQLELLFKESQEAPSINELCNLTDRMIEVYKVLHSIMFN